ncbi:hypothetical protein ANDA3_3189 [plant metagenome]|uniref:Uncharacterized protein n=2 Tax=root TaxID=1 RepID=A0A1C3K0C4_9BURK|nr:hypothetical protein [Orrella dioscoreae]SBT24952.1 hypothetical protein ODI_00344 [Orrella dioscoreae]SOE51093.1 hypothetical protein ODI_R3188 [Orrella dioscoreae]
MEHQTLYFIVGAISLLVLMAGYSARARNWGIYLMVVGVVSTFATIGYGIHMAFL